MYSRWRHPPKTVSPRPYCRSRRGRNGLGSETTPAVINQQAVNQQQSPVREYKSVTNSILIFYEHHK